MPLIKPSRRKLITGVAAFAAMCDLSPDPAEAILFRNGGTRATPVPPPGAVAVGYNTLAFYDDFDSSDTIDLSNTRMPGFNWYLYNQWPNATNTGWQTMPNTQVSQISVANSVLTLSGLGGGYGGNLIAASVNPSNVAAYIGNAFGVSSGGGFYAECRMAYTTPTNAGANGWPTFWAYSVDSQLNPSYSPFEELDMFESTNGGSQNNAIFRYTGPSTTNENTNASRTYSITPENFNIYAYRWCTTGMNIGGTGIGEVDFFINNTIIGAASIQYSAGAGMVPGMTGTNPNGCLFEMESQKFFPILSWGSDQPSNNVDWVRVWQL